jgi:AbiJ N-terminal domain 4
MERGNQPEIYRYEHLPIKFRNQVVHIWTSTITARSIINSPFTGRTETNYWDSILKRFLRELGEFQDPQDRPENKCISFLLGEEISIDNMLDLIELTFQFIDGKLREQMEQQGIKVGDVYNQLPDDAINELNHRFREHAIGYQYSSGQIIRVDSGFIHAEVVIPALSLLSSQDFSGAEQEFLLAHEYYRKQKYKEAITNALKAFESTMKTICTKCGWAYKPNACAKDLIKVVFDNKLLPEYLKTQFSTLKSILESGIPTVRNKTSGHGQGEQPTVVPEYLTAYVLHLTASNIVFLMEAYKSQESISK